MQLETTVVDYGNGIYAIDQQMVRAFLLVGNKSAILLDTGAVRADLKTKIKKLTDLPVTVFLTHGDGDHIGNLQDFHDAWICEKDMASVLSHPHCRDVKLHALTDGKEYDIGGRRLRVLFTPGHTAGSVSLLDAENHLLFSGDTVSYGPVFMFEERRNLREYLHTLEHLREMKNAGIFYEVYCCHNTCQIPADTVDDLIACASGILDHSIPGVPAPMPVPTDKKPLLGKYGQAGILF